MIRNPTQIHNYIIIIYFTAHSNMIRWSVVSSLLITIKLTDRHNSIFKFITNYYKYFTIIQTNDKITRISTGNCDLICNNLSYHGMWLADLKV